VDARILTDLQERVLRDFFRLGGGRLGFYLTGGTALAAFHLHHRTSEDLDLFSEEGGCVEKGGRIVAQIARDQGLGLRWTRQGPAYAEALLGGPTAARALKVDVVQEAPPHLGTVEDREGVLVDNPLNIAVNKVTALSRQEPKDYVDLYFLVTDGRVDRDGILRLAGQKDPGFSELLLAGQLARGRHFFDDKGAPCVPWPRMVRDVPPAEFVSLFQGWADEIFRRFSPPSGPGSPQK
jgi:hypothetical protein